MHILYLHILSYSSIIPISGIAVVTRIHTYIYISNFDFLDVNWIVTRLINNFTSDATVFIFFKSFKFVDILVYW